MTFLYTNETEDKFQKYISIPIKIINEYLLDQNTLRNTLELNYKKFDDKSSKDPLLYEKNFVVIKKIISKLIYAIGSLMSKTVDDEYKKYIDCDFSKNIFKVLCQNSNDPFILTGCCKFVKEIILNDSILDDKISFNKIIEQLYHFRNLINYIDNGTPDMFVYRIMCEKLEKLGIYKDIRCTDRSLKDPFNFNSMKNPIIIGLFDSILDLLLLISKFSVSNTDGRFQSMNVINNLKKEKNLLTSLGNCLKINNDSIRKKVIQCFYAFDNSFLTNSLSTIIEIVKGFNDVTEGETEIILSYIYAVLNRIANEKKTSEKATIDNVIEDAFVSSFDFLVKNLDRGELSQNEEDIVQKNMLSISILSFLNTMSKSSLFPKHIKIDKCLKFKKILYSDYIDLPCIPKLLLDINVFGIFIFREYLFFDFNSGDCITI